MRVLHGYGSMAAKPKEPALSTHLTSLFIDVPNQQYSRGDTVRSSRVKEEADDNLYKKALDVAVEADAQVLREDINIYRPAPKKVGYGGDIQILPS